MRRTPSTLILLLATAVVTLLTLGAAPQQVLPPFPVTYSGDITVQGQAAPARVSLVACVDGCDSYESGPITTGAGGSYRGLVVGPPSDEFLSKQITFWIANDHGRIQAAETPVYQAPSSPADFTQRVDLTFTDPVPGPPPPPATATPPPTPVLPIPGDPAVTQIPMLAVAAGIAALAVGASALFLVTRRRAL